MRFLFALRHAGYARNFQSTLRALSERGHEVMILERSRGDDGATQQLLSRLASELPGLSVQEGVEPRGSKAQDFAGVLRSWVDYLRFLEPEFASATKLRARSGRNLPDELRDILDSAGDDPGFRTILGTSLGTIERLLPAPAEVRELVERERPDAVLVSPLIERRTPQVAYLRAAAELGIPSGLCVASWDNLTTGPLIHEAPGLVTVWNEAQRDEATELHGVPAESVAVTGAPLFDEWFEQSASTSPADFRARVGLPAGRPYVLYVASSGFIAPDEAAWIVRWLDRVRSSGHPELRDLAVLVRPHPQARLLDESRAANRLQRMDGVVVHPAGGAHVVDQASLADYFDAIHHSSAVVGVNTSAMIESAIVGRGVHVLLAKRYRETQSGLPHFAHLQTAGGGLVTTSARIEAHAEGLARAIRGDDAEEVASRSRAFLEAFIRPQGLDQPATPLMADALEQLAREHPEPRELLGPAGRELVGDALSQLEAAMRPRRA